MAQLRREVSGLREQVAASDGVAAAITDEQRAAAERLDALEGAVESVDRSVDGLGARVVELEASGDRTADPVELAALVEPSVFTVEAGDALGSAFVARSSGGRSSLVTNFHVVEQTWHAGGRQVRLLQDDLTFTGTVTAVSVADDLALIVVDATFPALTLSVEAPTVGEPVIVVGSPLGLGGSVAAGIVSAVRSEGGVRYIQFSAPISPGNSGGPVVDHDGAVIGVAVAKLVGDGAEGLGFSIPADRLCPSLGLC